MGDQTPGDPRQTLQTLESGGVPRGETMLCSGTDPESYTTEYTLVYENKMVTPATSARAEDQDEPASGRVRTSPPRGMASKSGTVNLSNV